MRTLQCLLVLIIFLGNTSVAQNIPTIDISNETFRHIIIADGAEEKYPGHPATVLMADGKTMYCIWSTGEEHATSSMAVSYNGGINWEKINNRLPAGFRLNENCPGIYRMLDMKTGKTRLWAFPAEPDMPRIMSEDGGKTWIEESPLATKYPETFNSIVKTSDGNYMGFYHRNEDGTLKVLQAKTEDGGITWSSPHVIADIEGKEPCNPFVFRSPNNKELCCIMAENTHKGRSLMMFSKDEGSTWSNPEPTSWELTGDGYQGIYTKDERLVITFRDMVPDSPTKGHLMAWIGTYDDIKNCNAGEYRIKLLHDDGTNSDSDYPGIEILPDGTIIAITHIKYKDNKDKRSVVSIRFDIHETDAKAAKYFVDNSEKTNVPAYFQKQTLFKRRSGEKKIRIPSIIIAPDGTILAFARGCSSLRKSYDNGKTWTQEEEVKGVKEGNVLVDEVTKNIIIISGTQTDDPCIFRSNDNGNTWKKESISIKANVRGDGGAHSMVPINIGAMSNGITLKYGEHKGRLLQPGRVQPPFGNNEQEYWMYFYNTSMYSDDRGKTWQVSDGIMSGTGEATLTELSDGRVYYNSRSHMSIDHKRRIAWSYDGGNRYVDWYASEELYEVGERFYFKYGSKPSYGCMAGLKRIPDGVVSTKDVLLYSSPDWKGGFRFKMTVWASFNGASTWPVKRLIDPGLSAYSSIAVNDDGMIFLLYEGGEKQLQDEINIAVFNLKWLFEETDY